MRQASESRLFHDRTPPCSVGLRPAALGARKGAAGGNTPQKSRRPEAYATPVCYSCRTIGIRQPVPNARDVTFRTGAACFRLNSAIRTSRSTRRTVASSKPCAMISSADWTAPRAVPESGPAARTAAGCPGRSGSGRSSADGALVRIASGMSGPRVIPPARNAVHHHLRQVRDHRQAAVHVAVQRAVPDRHLATCCRWSAAATRTCSTAPSAGCRGCATGCSPRSRPVASPRNASASASSYVFMMPQIGSCSVRMPRFRASSSESSRCPRSNRPTASSPPSTFSGPIASAAIAAVSAESMPPDSPSSTCRNRSSAHSRGRRAPARSRFPPRE